MYINGVNKPFLTLGDSYVPKIAMPQMDVSLSIAEKKDENSSFSVSISRQGKNLSLDHEMRFSNSNQDQAPTEEEKERIDKLIDPMVVGKPIVSGRVFLNENAILNQRILGVQNSDTKLESEYQSLLTQESYENFKESNPELIEQLIKSYDDRKSAVKPELIVRDPNDPNAPQYKPPGSSTEEKFEIMKWRQDFMQNNMSVAAQDMARELGNNTGKQIISDSLGFQVHFDTDDKLFEIGGGLLEFMAEHDQHQNIWEDIVNGKYANLNAVDEALRANGDNKAADDLKKAVIVEPPSEDMIRQNLSANIFFDMTKTIYLGRTEEEKNQSNIDYETKRAYAKSIVSSDMVKKYQDTFQKQNESAAEKLYQQNFGSASLKYTFV